MPNEIVSSMGISLKKFLKYAVGLILIPTILALGLFVYDRTSAFPRSLEYRIFYWFYAEELDRLADAIIRDVDISELRLGPISVGQDIGDSEPYITRHDDGLERAADKKEREVFFPLIVDAHVWMISESNDGGIVINIGSVGKRYFNMDLWFHRMPTPPKSYLICNENMLNRRFSSCAKALFGNWYQVFTWGHICKRFNEPVDPINPECVEYYIKNGN